MLRCLIYIIFKKTLFRRRIFSGCPLPKTCHTYHKIMKLYSCTLPKEDPKNKWITWHTSWVLITSAFFHRFSTRVLLINLVAILMMSAKLVTLGLFKVKILWNEGYVVKVFVHCATNKILSCDSIYNVDVVFWPKFGNSSISMKELIITLISSIYWQEKPAFLRGVLVSSLLISGLYISANLRVFII